MQVRFPRTLVRYDNQLDTVLLIKSVDVGGEFISQLEIM